jgi:predicted Fe-Mo cluster-binding NifX family protein
MAVRIGIPTHKGGLEDTIADRFGRASTITVVEVDESTGKVLKVEVHPNPGYQAGSGAGVKAAQKLGELKVQVYVGPTPGPNAWAAHQYLGIKVIPLVGVSVKQAIEKALEEIKQQ